jgi:hypothetical protein
METDDLDVRLELVLFPLPFVLYCRLGHFEITRLGPEVSG